ncbi:MAG: amidase [Rhodomicrobium sp.]
MAPDFDELDALGAAASIKARRIAASAYTRGLVSRIDAMEPDIQAWQYFDAEHALAQARRLDARPDLSLLPLAGVAVGVKDVIDTADMPTENGTELDAGRRPQTDAAVVRLLREAGAIVMGKTVTTELAFMHPSKTRNPRNLEHSPGGSSSGSAAAVAAGMVPVALGTQTNGSVIRPASFCGVYGLKPTYGLFPSAGVLEEAPSLDTVGVFARTLGDIAAVTQVLAQGSGKRQPVREYLRAAREPAARFAFVRTPAWGFAAEPARSAFEAFAKALGPACETLDLPAEFDRAIGFHRTIMLTELALNYARYYEMGKERLSTTLREAIEAGRGMLAVDYAEALRERERLYERFATLIEPFDAILTLPAAGPAPRGIETTGNPVFCTLWTYLGVPALNLPLLEVNGMPLGIQLVGQRFGEEKLFRAAVWLLSRGAAG